MKSIFRAVIAVVALTACLVSIPTTAQAWRVGNWVGSGYTSNRTGAFSHCMMWVRYRSGITLYFLQFPNYNLYIGMGKPSWSMNPQGNYTMQLQIDGRIVRSARGRVLAGNVRRIWLGLGTDRYTRNRLQRGIMLTLINGSQRYRFRLTATAVALARLERCIRYQGG